MKEKCPVTYWLLLLQPYTREDFSCHYNYFVSHDGGWEERHQGSSNVLDKEVFTMWIKMAVPLFVTSLPENSGGHSSYI
jgi:hypothetical protein